MSDENVTGNSWVYLVYQHKWKACSDRVMVQGTDETSGAFWWESRSRIRGPWVNCVTCLRKTSKLPYDSYSVSICPMEWLRNRSRQDIASCLYVTSKWFYRDIWCVQVRINGTSFTSYLYYDVLSRLNKSTLPWLATTTTWLYDDDMTWWPTLWPPTHV